MLCDVSIVCSKASTRLCALMIGDLGQSSLTALKIKPQNRGSFLKTISLYV